MATRTFHFKYGDITIGGSSESAYILVSPIRLTYRYLNLRAECEVLVRALDTTSMESARSAIEAEFRKPFKDLQIKYGSTTRTYSQSDNTGFNQAPSITRMPAGIEHGLAAKYLVVVSLGLPADRSGDNALADLAVTVQKERTGLRVITITGFYTASGANSAVAQFDAQIETLSTSIKTEVDPDAEWELESTDRVRDKENKGVRFSRVYRERTETFKFQYGTITIGVAPYILISPIVIDLNYRQITVIGEVLLRETTTGAMETARAALEAEFRIPFKTLVITRSGVATTYDHSANSGFNHQPFIIRADSDPADDPLAARYTVGVTVQLPANRSGDNGLADLDVQATTIGGNNLRVATIRGVYTAQSGASATATYLANIAALVSSIQTEIDPAVLWEPVLVNFIRDKENKVVTFEHEYRQIIDREDVSTIDNANIRNSRTTVTVNKDYNSELPEDIVDRDEILQIDYSCQVLYDNTTEDYLKNIFNTTILPNLMAKITRYQGVNGLSSGSISVLRLAPLFDTASSSIAVTIIVIVIGNPLLAGRISLITRNTPPWESLPVFAGDNFGKVIVYRSAMAMALRSVVVAVRGTEIDARGRALALLPPFPGAIEVGSGSQNIAPTNRYELPPLTLINDWRKVLTKRFDGEMQVEVQGPFYKGFNNSITIFVVSITQEAEYFENEQNASFSE